MASPRSAYATAVDAGLVSALKAEGYVVLPNGEYGPVVDLSIAEEILQRVEEDEIYARQGDPMNGGIGPYGVVYLTGSLSTSKSAGMVQPGESGSVRSFFAGGFHPSLSGNGGVDVPTIINDGMQTHKPTPRGVWHGMNIKGIPFRTATYFVEEAVELAVQEAQAVYDSTYGPFVTVTGQVF